MASCSSSFPEATEKALTPPRVDHLNGDTVQRKAASIQELFKGCTSAVNMINSSSEKNSVETRAKCTSLVVGLGSYKRAAELKRNATWEWG